MTSAVLSCILLHSCVAFHVLSTAAVASLSKYRQAFVSLPSLPPLPTSWTYGSMSPSGPQCIALCTSVQCRYAHSKGICAYQNPQTTVSLLHLLLNLLFHTRGGNTCVHVHKVKVYVCSTYQMCEFMSKLLVKEFIDVCTVTNCPTEDQYPGMRHTWTRSS